MVKINPEILDRDGVPIGIDDLTLAELPGIERGRRWAGEEPKKPVHIQEVMNQVISKIVRNAASHTSEDSSEL
jgi:hypothetical protein